MAAAGPPPLEFLDVSKNPLGDEGGAALLLALATSPTLTGLVLAEAGLGAGAAAALASALGPCPPSPAGVGAPLSTAGVEAGLATAPASSGQANALPPPPSPATSGRGLPLLKTLDVSKNDLGAGGVAELAGALSDGGGAQLESLSIGYNDVGDEGAAALGRAAGPRLSVLDLSGNALSGAGLAAALSAPGLREAKLFHNACGDEGNIAGCRRFLPVPMVSTHHGVVFVETFDGWRELLFKVLRRNHGVSLICCPSHCRKHDTRRSPPGGLGLASRRRAADSGPRRQRPHRCWIRGSSPPTGRLPLAENPGGKSGMVLL